MKKCLQSSEWPLLQVTEYCESHVYFWNVFVQPARLGKKSSIVAGCMKIVINGQLYCKHIYLPQKYIANGLSTD